MPWGKEISYDRYPSDLSNEEWQIIEEILTESDRHMVGRPRQVDLREIVNAIFYLNKTGCPWRYLPKDFPNYTLVSYYYHKWVEQGMWEEINAALRRQLRKEVGRNEEPSAGIIDSQTVKGTPESAQESGFDGGKLIKGRKRPIVVDTMGCIIIVIVHAANIYDGRAARQVLTALFSMTDTIARIWADGGYQGELIEWAKKKFGCVMKIVKKKKRTGFHVLPRRWVVERTFAWLSRFRRLSKDYERNPTSSAGHIYVASIRLLLQKICKVRFANISLENT